MINRQNWKLTKAYIEYREAVDGLAEGSVEVERTHLRHILEWADETSFIKAKTVRPVLPEYVQALCPERGTGHFSNIHASRILATARRLFYWAGLNDPTYRSLTGAWIETIKPKRVEGLPKNIEAVSLEEILRIAAAPVEDIVERRISVNPRP